MKTNHIPLVLAASLLAFSHSALAQTLVESDQMTFIAGGQGFVRQYSPTPARNNWPGFNLYFVEGYGPMYQFCVEYNVISLAGDDFEFVSVFDAISPERASLLGAFLSNATPLLDAAWNDHYQNTGDWGNTEDYLDVDANNPSVLTGIGAAMQLVIWEIIEEDAGNPLDVTSGFLAHGDHGSVPANPLIWLYANDFTSYLNDGTWTDAGGLELFYGVTQSGAQNMFFLELV